MTFKIFTEANLRAKSIDALKRRLRRQMGGYMVSTTEIRAGNVLYRGVRCSPRPATVGRISYPPEHMVTKPGRANRAGCPVFYCSPAAPAVFYELKAKAGDFIALSEWELVEPIWMHNLGFHQDALLRMGAPIDMRPRLTDPIPNETPANAALRARLSLAFTEDVPDGQEYRYKQSIAIHELMFDRAEPIRMFPDGPRSGRVAGTVYPTMRMKGSADNAVLWPKFVDSSLRIKSVRHVLVEAVDEASSSYTFLTVDMSEAFHGQDIDWRASLPPENSRRSHIALEDDVWILRNGDGEVYDRHRAGPSSRAVEAHA